MKIDVVLTSGPPDVRALSRSLHDAGVDGIATVEGPHDVFFPLVQGSAVEGLDIASYVAIAFPRSPVHLAHAAWDLQSLSGGRSRLGLGTQVRAHVERRYGADFDRPAARMAEWVGATRAIFDCWQNGARLDFDGEFTQHTLMPPLLSPPPLASGPPPILVGALGPTMVEMTTAVADGIVLHPMTSEGFLRAMVDERIDAGLSAAGRSRERFEVVGGCLVGIHRGDDETAVRDGRRSLVAFWDAPTRSPRRCATATPDWSTGSRSPSCRNSRSSRSAMWSSVSATDGDACVCVNPPDARCGIARPAADSSHGRHR
ncbi:MAG: LLM class flavin-dependent oxidoreductase [Acidimicrobiales bacterium]|nr:LLM class flavin-dependent oxidoreductase [Acidimicrobiales bacterium]